MRRSVQGNRKDDQGMRRNRIVPFVLAVLLSAIYSTADSYDVKKEGLAIVFKRKRNE